MQKKRIMIGALALVVVALVASWGVNAYFNDTEGTTANKVTAGTLDLQLDDADDVTTALFVVDPVYPGYTSNGTGVKMVLTNIGNISGVLTMAVSDPVGAPGVETEPEEDVSTNDDTNGNLQDVLMVNFMAGSTTIYEGLLSEYTTTWSASLVATTGTTTVTMYVWVPTAVGNEIQGDSLTFDITFTLHQDADGNGVIDG